ncbi:MAG: metal-binding protein [Cyanobacteria bacterium J083]|nr:MAG: metal-binding protein [Cyanobacteria bacterium J083]
MPSGKTHDRITLWCFPVIVLLSGIVTQKANLTLLVVCAYLFSGLMFGPDLDIYSIQYKRWGKIRWIWLPYQKAFRHRSGFSHGLLIGTTIRLVYFSFVLWLLSLPLIAIMQLIWGFDWNWQTISLAGLTIIRDNYQPEAIATFFGLELGAMSHSLSDWLSSQAKQHKKNKRKKRAK